MYLCRTQQQHKCINAHINLHENAQIIIAAPHVAQTGLTRLESVKSWTLMRSLRR